MLAQITNNCVGYGSFKIPNSKNTQDPINRKQRKTYHDIAYVKSVRFFKSVPNFTVLGDANIECVHSGKNPETKTSYMETMSAKKHMPSPNMSMFRVVIVAKIHRRLLQHYLVPLILLLFFWLLQ